MCRYCDIKGKIAGVKLDVSTSFDGRQLYMIWIAEDGRNPDPKPITIYHCPGCGRELRRLSNEPTV